MINEDGIIMNESEYFQAIQITSNARHMWSHQHHWRYAMWQQKKNANSLSQRQLAYRFWMLHGFNCGDRVSDIACGNRHTQKLLMKKARKFTDRTFLLLLRVTVAITSHSCTDMQVKWISWRFERSKNADYLQFWT